MFKTTLCLFAFALIAGGQARADVYDFKANTTLQTLVTVSNDRDSGLNILSGMVDDHNVLTGFEFASVQGGHQVSQEQFSMDKVSEPNGVVLINSQGVDAVILRGKLIGGEADMVVKFINNGLTHEYHECKMQVVRGPDNIWRMKNAYTGQIITKAKIITWQLGIKTLQGICQ